MVELSAEQFFARITRKPILILIIFGVGASIYLHPEWSLGWMRTDRTTWDNVIGIMGSVIVLAGACFLLFLGLVPKDGLAAVIGVAIAVVGFLLIWLTIG